MRRRFPFSSGIGQRGKGELTPHQGKGGGTGGGRKGGGSCLFLLPFLAGEEKK